MNVLDVNSVNLRNAYPTAVGNTIGISGGAMNQTARPAMPTQTSGEASEVEKAISVGNQGSAVIGGVVFLALLIGLMMFARYISADKDFSNLKPSAYNVLTISLAAIVGMPIWKYLVTRFPIPGVSTWVLSA